MNDQFKTPALQTMVKGAAAESTQAVAEPLIKSEVAIQVKSRVDAERPTITAAVTHQTQAAVKDMSPQIDLLVKRSVDAKVATDVEPFIQRVKNEADLQLLIIRMNADDAEAFDTLLNLQAFPDPSQKRVVESAVRSVFLARNGGMFTTRSFHTPLTDDQLIAALSSTEATTRQAALDTLPSKAKPSLLPKVVEMIRSDPSLDVRCSAYRLFNALTKQTFQNLDKAAVLNWWESNKQQLIEPTH